MSDPYVEAGARAILRRALVEHGIEGSTLHNFHTDALVVLARDYRAPVEKIIGWWEIMAEGKPHLTDRQRELILWSADRARELAGVPR